MASAGPGPGSAAPDRTNHVEDAPELGGGEIRFLENKGSIGQQLSAVIQSSDGHVIVVDGGQPADTEHLLQVIKEKGGHVDAWLITHPQTDHVGALTDILENHARETRVDGFYYHFTQCPLNTFARREGLLDVLPVMCEMDFLTAGLMHAKLHRENTLAGGGKICDYWFYGDQMKDPR